MFPLLGFLYCLKSNSCKIIKERKLFINMVWIHHIGKTCLKWFIYSFIYQFIYLLFIYLLIYLFIYLFSDTIQETTLKMT